MPPMNSGPSGGPKADARGGGRADLRRFVPSEWDQVRATPIEPALPFQPIGAQICPVWRAISINELHYCAARFPPPRYQECGNSWHIQSAGRSLATAPLAGAPWTPIT
jgi:hypothetical protein